MCCSVCPEKCVCEAAASVQCFRVQSVPSGLAGEVRKLNLGHNHIKEIKVMLNIHHLIIGFQSSGFLRLFSIISFLGLNKKGCTGL